MNPDAKTLNKTLTKLIYTMINWVLSCGCKDGSKSADQSMQHVTLTKEE